MDDKKGKEKEKGKRKKKNLNSWTIIHPKQNGTNDLKPRCLNFWDIVT